MSEQPRVLLQKPRELSPDQPARVMSPHSVADSIDLMASIAREDKPVHGEQASFVARPAVIETTCGLFCKNLSAEQQRSIIMRILDD